MGCSNRSWSLMWLDWSFNQASPRWLYGTLESSGSTQPHCRKGGLTLGAAAGTGATCCPLSLQGSCAGHCPLLSWQCQVLLCCSRACLLAPSLTSAPLRCPGGVNSPSTHRTTPLDLSEGHSHPQWDYSLCYFPSHHDTSFPWRNTQWVTDLFPLWTDPAQQVLHHYPKYPQETDRPTVNANNPLLHTLIGKVPSLSCNSVLSLFAFVFSHPPSYGVHIPSPETEAANQ